MASSWRESSVGADGDRGGRRRPTPSSRSMDRGPRVGLARPVVGRNARDRGFCPLPDRASVHQ